MPLLAERGVVLSAAQVYRLVAQTPERLHLRTLVALCDILGASSLSAAAETAPVLRWRMRSPEQQSWIPFPEGWLERVGGHGFVDRVLRLVDTYGPVSAGEITPAEQRKPSGWFNWSDTKLALEWLFYTGRVTIASRRNFTRMYDLTEWAASRFPDSCL